VVIRQQTYRTETVETVDTTTPLETEIQQTEIEPSPFSQYGAPASVLLAMVALLGLLVMSYTGRLQLSEAERERCTLHDERTQFDEWISHGDVPSIDQFRVIVKMESLSGLVDLAIDTNNRVIEDDNAYFVIRGQEDTAYVYAPKLSRMYDWLYLNSGDVDATTLTPDSLWPENHGDDEDLWEESDDDTQKEV